MASSPSITGFNARFISTAGLLWGAWLLSLVLLLVQPTRAWDASRMQAAAQRLGPRAVAALPALHNLLHGVRAMHSDGERLVAVNRFFNQRLVFRNDAEVWGVEDHWASPLEALGKGLGDCEDYAIAKYASLLAAGMVRDKLRLVYVRAELPGQSRAQAHMILAYYPAAGAEPMILDNLVPDVQPASQRKDLSPVFSFNSEGLWEGVSGAAAGDPLVRLSRWRDAWAKTLEEGF